MSKEVKHPYSFSFITALLITGITLVGLVIFELIFFSLNLPSLLVFSLFVFVFSFLVIQFRVEKFVYERIKQLYKNISLLASSTLEEDQVTTNMEELTHNIEKFAEKKKLEIEALKIRENYRREFIGNVSHELKTPLFTIQGYLLMLLDEEMEDEKLRKQYLERTHKSVERLIYIVNDLDMITKLESGSLSLTYEDFDIVGVISGVMESFEKKAKKKKISLMFDHHYKSSIWVHADKKRIQQVITNLINNSIKYGKEKGTMEINIEELTDDKYIIRITDNGEGFKKEDIPRLFERFFRVDKSGSRKEGGSGLGLAIVKHILEAHKEKIYVESDYGIGSEFSFTLKRGKKSG